MSETYNRPEQRIKNWVEIERPEAVYKIIYGEHQKYQDTNVFDDTKGILIEGLWLENKPPDAMFIKQMLNSKQTEQVLTYAIKNKKPLYFIDSPKELTDKSFAMSSDILLPILETLIAMALSKIPYENLSRRRFMSTVYRGGISTAQVYLLSPLISRFTDAVQMLTHEKNLDENDLRRKVSRFKTSLEHTLHPELGLIILRLRNLIMAQKGSVVARKDFGSRDKKPKLGYLVGSAHIGLEDSLVLDEESRVKAIRSITDKLSINNLGQIYKMVPDSNPTIEEFYDPKLS
ncbi:MAG: hypothetical protein WC794_04700 [Candidatus Doudnabacteria bacterium]|jgi:hypothetical protein